jgi:hypothetical protein
MPRLPMDYTNTIIYSLVCKSIEVRDMYVGHTTNFSKRKSRHKDACINNANPKYVYPVYRKIRETGGWDNWAMVMIEQYPCENRLTAERREREHIEALRPSLNKMMPGGGRIISPPRVV